MKSIIKNKPLFLLLRKYDLRGKVSKLTSYTLSRLDTSYSDFQLKYYVKIGLGLWKARVYFYHIPKRSKTRDLRIRTNQKPSCLG